MALVNPGLADRLESATNTVRSKEAAARDNPYPLGLYKALVSYALLMIIALLWRPDGTNALDYDDAQRTSAENFSKQKAVRLLAWYLSLLRQEPVRTWPEVDTLAQCLDDLTTSEATDWPLRSIELGGVRGIAVDRTLVAGGSAEFETPDGMISADVYRARDPDVALNGVWLYLVEELSDSGELQGRYALMVADEYWGQRIQPAQFTAPPFVEEFVMAYWLEGEIRHDGVPQEGANVSLEVTLQTAEDGLTTFWDSEEYNELVWSPSLETYVCGATVRAPIQTAPDGRWSFIAPKGHGAIYQRDGDWRDESPETREQPLSRYVEQIMVAYCGRKVPVAEGSPALVDICSGRLTITATPDAYLRVGTLDDAGQSYQVPPSGTVEITGLPAGEHNIVQFKRTGSDWDACWGCPRVTAEVTAGETTAVQMPPLEYYSSAGDIACGRVYLRPGVPAAGIDITIVDTEFGEIVGVAATTNESGYWSVEIPPEGLGGDLYILDEQWGSLPIVGFPYSDVVLGARAYAGWMEDFKPECWRTGSYGHHNFQYIDKQIHIEDNDTGRKYPTEEAPYGGYLTEEILPKYKYIADVLELLIYGTQLKSYAIVADEEVLDPDFHLRAQSFEEAPTLAGAFRAAGYYPETKFLFGGKIKANIVKHSDQRLDEDQPEAARVGLEFGTLKPYMELRQVEQAATAFSDLICPYCGGPAQRDRGQTVPRGFCLQCAYYFSLPQAMDCRSYLRSPTLASSSERRRHRVLTGATRYDLQQTINYHWRPDLYDETEAFLTQTGPGQATNAPRWFVKHLNEVGDGKGLGQFDGDQTPPFIPGHDLDYFGALSYVDRNLGLAQFKLAFAEDYEVPIDFTVEIDCQRADDEIETITVAIPQGTRGPSVLDPFGEVILLRPVLKLLAETKDSPYPGCGFYQAVTDIRLVEPEQAPGCRFTVIADVPFLAHPQGVLINSKQASFVALQIGGNYGRPHIFEDAVGQLFLFDVQEGNIRMRRKGGLTSPWEAPRWVTNEGNSDYPWADKDNRGRIILSYQQGPSQVKLLHSPDDGHSWEEV